jgi:Flp pilus assembly protein protease CpaA
LITSSVVIQGVILVLCGIAAVTDVRTGHIPNRLVAWGVSLGVAMPVTSALFAAPEGALLAALGEGLGRALVGLLVTAAVPLALFLLRALGGGDVKLFAAVGALGGPSLGFAIVSHAFFLAVPLAVSIWLRQGRLRAALGTTGRLALSWAPRWVRQKAGCEHTSSTVPGGLPRRVRRAELTRVRFAPAILLAALWVLLVR